MGRERKMVTVPGGAAGLWSGPQPHRKHWSAGECGESVCVGRILPEGPADGWQPGGQASIPDPVCPCRPSSSNVPQCCAHCCSLDSPSSSPLCWSLAGFLLPCSARFCGVLAEPGLFICSEFCDPVPPLLGKAMPSSHSCFPSDSKCFPASSLGPGEIREWLFGQAPERSG